MTERTYRDKDMVFIDNERSSFDLTIGIVEIREGWDTDLVWIGGSAVTQAPENIQRIKPGTKVARR